LLIRFYADPDFGRAFRYDREDITRARRNEEHAARDGLRSEIENPLTGKPVGMRDFLKWTLNEVQPLAEALGLWADLTPLVEMAQGSLNTAERLRARLRTELGSSDEVPVELLRALAEERQDQVRKDVETIAGIYPALDGEAARLGEFLQRARDDVRLDPQAPIRFRPRPEGLIELTYPDKTSEIVALAQQLIQIPSVTACPDERVDEVHRAATFIFDYLRNYGVGVRYYNKSKYPAILAGFPDNMLAPVMLSGHFDVVAPEPDDSQFEPRVEGDYLWGRGAADMKTVVATYLVWLKDTLRQGPPYPPINLLLVGNEENGEVEPMGTPHILKILGEDEKDRSGLGYVPRLLIAGERTGEHGDELWGEICTQNRGVMRFQVVARGQRGHSGVASSSSNPATADLTEKLLLARAAITGMFGHHLTLSSPDGWQSQARFPFIQIGTQGVYNVTADAGYLGIEVRPIPQDNLAALLVDLRGYCESQGLEFLLESMEEGIICNPDQPYLQALIEAVRTVSGEEPRIGRKLPGTSARFAPGGQGVVWGQSGLGPHARNERHFIPSIMPYYRSLNEYGKILNFESIG
jgi:acetylornithine deacetylase/succinyl-diaminopimelate desuccinylase-like protein